MIDRYPLELTQFKTDLYKPKDHFRIPKRWDNFTMHASLWKGILDNEFNHGTFSEPFSVLELGTGNGLCSNFLLENYSNCTLETVDIYDERIVTEGDTKYSVATTENLKPYIEENRCTFYNMSTKAYLDKYPNKQFDFIYIDASHDPDWVLHDSLRSFFLLKKGGLIIFDDFGMEGCRKGVLSFLNCYNDYLEPHSMAPQGYWQLFMKKTKELYPEDVKS